MATPEGSRLREVEGQDGSRTALEMPQVLHSQPFPGLKPSAGSRSGCVLPVLGVGDASHLGLSLLSAAICEPQGQLWPLLEKPLSAQAGVMCLHWGSDVIHLAAPESPGRGCEAGN